jgi:anti-sigma regulatory factor (Ser/Thr protein kinase)
MLPTEQRTHHVPLPRSQRCTAVARQAVRERLSELDPPVIDDLILVVSELVSNAFVHGAGDIELRLTVCRDRIRVEVTDQGEGAEITAQDDPTALSGRGLMLVDQVSLGWGAHDGTAHVWAEVPVESGL